MKTLLITPPLLQPNTPYAATPLLSGWLNAQGHETIQADLSLEWLLRLFSESGLRQLAGRFGLWREEAEAYVRSIEEVIAFLQGRSPGSAERISLRGWLPEGERLARAYAQEEQLAWSFRGADEQERARYLSSLFLDDIADAVAGIDPHFGFSRYAEKLAAGLSSFETLRMELERGSLFADWLEELVDDRIRVHAPELVALTVPFPGCLFGALVIARRIRQTAPDVHVTLGGGYVNTELRQLTDPRIFDYVDTLTLDSGFLPLQRIAERKPRTAWVRTYALDQGRVRFYNDPAAEPSHDSLPPPDYTGLPLDRYFGMTEVLNPMASLWSESRWNKLMLAHGCCWSRCAFCDTSIEYICRYDPASPETICNWIGSVMRRTGFNGFHFVDEALPPDLLEPLCDEILRRGIQIEWWGNVRFEKRFSRPLIRKMADAGCIAVTGGLETCCDRTLQLMRKGIRMAHAEQVIAEFSAAGIMTHAYLMYGFPTQTLQETMEALDTVRRLFDEGVLHSAYWHRFALTAHSTIALQPETYGIETGELPASGFAVNEIPFKAEFDHDPAEIGQILHTAMYNFQLGLGYDIPAAQWFGPGGR